LLAGAPVTSQAPLVARSTWLDPLPRRQRPIGQRGRTPTARFRGLADSPFARHHGDIGGADGERRQVHDDPATAQQIWRGDELIKTVQRTSRGEVRKKKASVQQTRA
jgi:hypothetical protein